MTHEVVITMRKAPLLLVVASLLASTAFAGEPTTQPAKPPPTNMMGDAPVLHRGAAFTEAKSVSLDDVIAGAATFAGKSVKVSGDIGAVCAKKGCWMILSGSKPQLKARVSFKDYAFFAPFDGKGKKATVEGVVEVKSLTEADRKHLAEDEGCDVKDVPENEVRIMAAALEVRQP